MSDNLRRSFVLLTLATAAMAALLALLPAAGHDQLWFLLMAKRWIGGATLYGPEIFDSNPPLIVWLSAIPVELSRLTSIQTTFFAKLVVVAVTTGVGLFSSRILSRVWHVDEPSERPALLFAFLTLFLLVPARDLGQRDALAGLLALPYVLTAARRPTAMLSLWSSAAAGLLAALAFCLKPQDALLAVVLEAALFAYAIRHKPSRRAGLHHLFARIEVPILLACGLLYLLAIRRFAPLYFSAALPILRSTYWAIGHLSLPALLWEAVELTLLVLLTGLLLLRSKPVTPAAKFLAIAGSGAFLAYLLQGTGWYYQQLPAICLFGAALALHLLDLQRRHPVQPPRWFVAALAALCLLAVGLATHFTGYPFTTDRAFGISSPDPAFFTSLPPGTPVAILTTSVDEAMMPVERYHLTWAQRTDNLWLLPAILQSERPDPAHPPRRHLTPLTLARLDGTQHRWMVEDLQRWQPKLVLIERCGDPHITCQVLEDRHDDLLAWFQRDPRFVQLWRNYSFAGTRGRFDCYVRKPRA